MYSDQAAVRADVCKIREIGASSFTAADAAGHGEFFFRRLPASSGREAERCRPPVAHLRGCYNCTWRRCLCTKHPSTMAKETPTYDTLKLPEHIRTVLLTGAGGECAFGPLLFLSHWLLEGEEKRETTS